jgi:DNA-binding response OmpR family regulator
MLSASIPVQVMNTQFKVLIADDDEVLGGMLVEYLAAEGFSVSWVPDGAAAVARVASTPPDLVVLDIMMPELNGMDALREIRRLSDVPVIMLTARGDDLDRILGLELGADDYVGKPCNPRELLARIRAVLRRGFATSTGGDAHGNGEQPLAELVVGDISLHPASRRVLVGGRGEIALTQTEFDLLYLMLANPDQLVDKADISLRVLGKPLAQWDRSIDVHISNLRRKLGPHADGSDRIRTVRGSGYLYYPLAQRAD